MGSDTYSTANFQIADTPAGHAALARAAARLVGIPELDIEVQARDCSDGYLTTVRDAIGAALGLLPDCDSLWTQTGAGVIAIGASGEGRHRGLDKVANILAAEGINGDVRFEDADCRPIRVRVAGGGVHEEIGEVVYRGGPVTDVWIVQMQAVDEGDFDRVALVRDKAEADATIAKWGREAIASLAAAGVPGAEAALNASDTDVLDVLMTISGVKWTCTMPILITIEIQDSYANGDDFTRTETVTVDPPSVGADLDDWAADTLFRFTGQGEQYAGVDGIHEIKVLDCVGRPELVGTTFNYG